MTVSTVGGATASSGLQNAGLGMQDFLKVLLTQLTYQDPLKPMDNQQFMAQMAQFTALQQTQQLNDNMTQLINNQASLLSIGLIGHTIDLNNGSAPASGKVTSLALNGDAPTLTVTQSDGTILTHVGLGQIINVK